jgi:hypothetical protein
MIAWTLLREYVSEVEARLDASVLEANGIPARVITDNAGGAFPSMAIVFPIRLMVAATDVALARELLDTPVDDADEIDELDDRDSDDEPAA